MSNPLRRFEERFSAAFRNCPATVSITSTRDNRYIDVNKTFERLTGYPRGEIIGRTPSDLGTWVDYSQRVALINRLSRERSIYDVEARFRRRGGQIWTGLSSLELIEVDEEPCALIVTADITDRKIAEAHSKLSQELIDAHEQERARIGWELRHHIDDLILVSINVNSFDHNSFEFEAEISGVPKRLFEDVVSRLLDLSHRLYPAKLDYLGLAAAAASFCKGVSETQNKRIDFHSEDVPTELPTDVSLCLYRVLQEALQHAIKNSCAQAFEVLLSGQSNEIHLSVRDWGAGPDSNELDLLRLKQRLKLVQGEVSIDSQDGCGTTMHVRVPIKKTGKPGVVI